MYWNAYMAAIPHFLQKTTFHGHSDKGGVRDTQKDGRSEAGRIENS